MNQSHKQFTQAVQRSYSLLAKLQTQLETLVGEKAEPENLAQAAQIAGLVERLTRQLLAMEKLLVSPQVLSAATLPFLEWLGKQDADQAAQVGDAYTQWLDSRAQA